MFQITPVCFNLCLGQRFVKEGKKGSMIADMMYYHISYSTKGSDVQCTSMWHLVVCGIFVPGVHDFRFFPKFLQEYKVMCTRLFHCLY